MSDYLIEIVAKLRDDASAKIKGLQDAVDELKAKSAGSNATNDLTQGFHDTADAAERAGEATQDLRKEEEEHARGAQRHQTTIDRAAKAHSDAAEAVGSHADAHSDLGNSLDDTVSKVAGADDAMRKLKSSQDDAGDSTADLAARVKEAEADFDDLSAAFRDGSGDLKQLRQDLSASGTELGALSRRFKTLDDDARGLRNLSEQAKAMASSLDKLDSSSRQPISANLGLDKAKQDLASLTQEYQKYSNAVQTSMNEADRAVQQHTQQQFASKFSGVARQLPVGGADFEAAVRQAVAARAASQEPRAARSTPADAGNALLGRMSSLDSSARNRTSSDAALTAGYKNISSGLRTVVNSLEAGSAEAEKFGDAMEDAAKKASNPDLARSGNVFSQFASKVASATDGIGIKVVSLSAQLRGLALVAGVALFQPLVTGAASLAGSLFSVASGAVQAGAALGGALVSGIGQAIPIVAVALSAFARLKSIFSAASENNQLQTSNAEGGQSSAQNNFVTQLQNATSLIDAQHQLTQSYQQLSTAQVEVTMSQQQLTQSRIDAIRNLQDLVIADQSAKLALSQSNLGLTQAQQALQLAQSTGSQEGIQQAQLAVRAAQIQQQQAKEGVPRAAQDLRIARRQGVNHNPSVESARQGVVQAHQGVTQARQGIGDAQRGLKIAQATSKEPLQTNSAQAQLNQITKTFDPVEKQLYAQILQFEKQLKDPNGPLRGISDAILEPFIYAFKRLNDLITNSSFLAPLQKLASAMGSSLQQIFGAILGPSGVGFFDTMAKDATKSVPIVTKSLMSLIKIFEDIAEDAAPAFDKLATAWAHFWGAMATKDSSAAGTQDLTKFFNKGATWAIDFGKLAVAVGKLFEALGRDAAPSGMGTVTTFTSSIKDATNWVNQHGPEVTHFFQQANQGLSVLGGVALTVGKDLLKIFSLSSLTQFASLLSGVVLPAATIFSNILGTILTAFMKLLNAVGPLKDVVIGLATAFIGLMALSKFITLVSGATKVLGGFHDALSAFKNADGFVNKLKDAWSALTDRITKGTSAMNKAKDANDALNDSENKGADKAGAEATAQGGLDTAEAGGATAGAADATAQGAVDTAETAGATAGAADATAQGAVDATEGAGGITGAGAVLGGVGGLATAGVLAGLVVESKFGPTDQQEAQASQNRAGGVNPRVAPFSSPTGYQGFQQAQEDHNNASAAQSIKKLHNELQNVTSPLDLTTRKLHDYYNQAVKLQQLPDITQKQRQGLGQLVTALNPVTVQIQKLSQLWGQTFSGINTTTGNVMKQVESTLKIDLQNISNNLGTGTQKGAEAFAATVTGAYKTVVGNTDLAASGVQAGLAKINTELNDALKAMGAPSLSNSLMKSLGPTQSMNWIQSQGTGGTASAPGMGHRADGGWNPAVPGGTPYVAGEAGYDEVTLTTDPSKSGRTKALLGQFLSKVPRMASGGTVSGAPGVTGQIAAYLIGHGMHKQAAAGVIGNMAQESGGDTLAGITPNITGDGGGGLVGWTPLSELTSFAASKGMPWNSLQLQLMALSAGIGGLTPLGSTLGAMNSFVNPQEAAAWWMNNWEHPLAATENAAGREHNAGIMFAILSGQKIPVGELGAGSGGGGSAPSINTPKIGGKGALKNIAQDALKKAGGAANSYLNQIYQRMAGWTGTGSPSAGGGGGGAGGGTAVKSYKGEPAGYGPIPRPMAGDYRDPPTQGPAGVGAYGGYEVAKWIVPMLQYGHSHGWGGDITSGYRPGNDPGTASGGPGEHAGTQYPHGAVDFGGPTGPGTAAFENRAAFFAAVGGFKGFQIIPEQFAPYSQYPVGDGGHASGTGHAAGGLLGGIGNIKNKLRAFATGGIAPWGGRPMPIIAHEGERISNPNQWHEVARMAGTTPTGLDAHLGYNGTPRQSFASGGKPTISSGIASGLSTIGNGILNADLSKASLGLASLEQYLSQFADNLFKFDPGSLSSGLANLSTVLSKVTKALADVNKLPIKEQTDKFSQVAKDFLDPNNASSVLNLLAAEFTRYQTNLANWVASNSFSTSKVSNASIAQPNTGSASTPGGSFSYRRPGYTSGTGYAGVQEIGQPLTSENIGHTGQASSDMLTVRSSSEQTQYLQGQSKELDKFLQSTKSRIKTVQSSSMSKSSKDTAIKKLQGIYSETVQKQTDLNNSINQQISTTFQAEQQYIQDTLNQINDVFGTQQAQLQAKQSTAESKGNYSALPNVDDAIVKSSQAELKSLQAPLEKAKKEGNSDLVAQILQQIAQLKETIGQTATQAIQDLYSGIEQKYQTKSASQQSSQSIAETQGNYGSASNIDQAIGQSAQAQIQALQAPLKQAKSKGDSQLVAQIEQEISGLQSTVAQSVSQMVQDQLAGVEQTFATISAQQGASQSSAQAMGNFSALPGIDQAIVDTTNQHIQALQQVLATAQATGNTSAAAQIQQEIAQLQGQVTQMTAQIIQDQISAIQQSAATQQAQVSEYQTISQVQQGSATTDAGFAQAFATNAAGLNLNQSSLQSQLAGYNGLLGEAIDTGNTGAVATLTQQIDALTAQLAQNTQAIDDNNANLVAAEASWTQGRASFQTGTLSGLVQAVTTVGQTMGTTNVPLLTSLTQAQNNVLGGTQGSLLGQLGTLGGGAGGLASSLMGAISDPTQFASILGGANLSGIESGQDQTWVNTFESLISNLTSNTEAIASNNQQLATLNGQLTQPQQWASSAWTNFRTAIFSGMGNLLPAYAASLAGTSALPTIAPTFSPVTGGANSPSIGTLNINHAPTSSLSPAVIGEQLAHETSTAL